MSEKKTRVTLSELILAAVCHLQEKNGVTADEIAEFIASKRGCKQEQIEKMIKTILSKAKNHGILSEKKGMYRIEDRFDDSSSVKGRKDKAPVTISDSEEEEEDYAVDEEGPSKEEDSCDWTDYSHERYEDEDDYHDDCFRPLKKRKCN